MELNTLVQTIKKAFSPPEQEELKKDLIYLAQVFEKSQNGLVLDGFMKSALFQLSSEAGQNYIHRTERDYLTAKKSLLKHYPESIEDEDIQSAINGAENAIPSADHLRTKLQSNQDNLKLIEGISSSTTDTSNIRQKNIADSKQKIENIKYLLETHHEHPNNDLVSDGQDTLRI